MNRIDPIALFGNSSISADDSSGAEVGASDRSLSTSQPTAMFAPLHYEANYAYPLLVWLHGPGADETHLRQIMPLISLRNYVAVGMRGTQSLEGPAGRPTYSWSQARAHVALAEQAVFEAIELSSRRYHIQGRRIFLAGYDAGGTMALRIALAHPLNFAGVLSLGGPLPDSRQPLLRLSDARRLPIFLAYARGSQSCSTADVCDNLRLLHSAGMNVALRQYPGGDELSELMLADMDRWMMEQITGVVPQTASA